MGFDGLSNPAVGHVRRVAVTVGGTLGHVHAALAIAQAYRDQVPNTEVCLLGPREARNAQSVARSGFAFEEVPALPVARQRTRDRLLAAARLVQGVDRARRVLAERAIELVVGCGGYASAPSVLAASTLGARIVLYEANVVPGLATRLLRPFADRIYVGWSETQHSLSPLPCKVTGNPLLDQLAGPGAREPGSTPPGRELRLLVLGGSQGSPFLNRRAPELAGALARQGFALSVQHQAGMAALEPVRRRYREQGVRADVCAHFPEIGAAYRSAQFAITCAGAITLAELSRFAIPALVVPLSSAAGGHQHYNARVFGASTGCPVITEEEWDVSRACAVVSAVLRDADRFSSVAERMGRLARPGAGSAIVRDCEALLAEGR